MADRRTPRMTNKEWLKLHREEYEKMIKSLGYANPTQQQTSDVIAYLRNAKK